MPQQFHVGASSMTATYKAGVFVAESAAEAIEMAREHYRNSPLGRQMKDVRTPDKREDDE